MARRMQALGSHADKPPLEEGGGEEVHRQEEEEDHQQALEGVTGDLILLLVMVMAIVHKKGF